MKKGKPVESVNTIVGRDTSFEGTIEFSGSIRIDGKVVGHINSDSGTVIIGETAKVEADIKVAIGIIRGDVTGRIDATDRIEVYPPASIDGNIVAPIISIDTGVVFNGNCEMTARTIASGKRKEKKPKKENPGEKPNDKSFIKTG
jgi:cytoskeletal protein CcmA (bactofilin family)